MKLLILVTVMGQKAVVVMPCTCQPAWREIAAGAWLDPMLPLLPPYLEPLIHPEVCPSLELGEVGFVSCCCRPQLTHPGFPAASLHVVALSLGSVGPFCPCLPGSPHSASLLSSPERCHLTWTRWHRWDRTAAVRPCASHTGWGEPRWGQSTVIRHSQGNPHTDFGCPLSTALVPQRRALQSASTPLPHLGLPNRGSLPKASCQCSHYSALDNDSPTQ